jgi:hypothetical protein
MVMRLIYLLFNQYTDPFIQPFTLAVGCCFEDSNNPGQCICTGTDIDDPDNAGSCCVEDPDSPGTCCRFA